MTCSIATLAVGPAFTFTLVVKIPPATPPGTTFTLALWNATGDGTNSVAQTITTGAAGVARFSVPLQAAFVLTTVPVS